MADKLIRIGRVSKVDYEHGMISVTYPDLDDAVTVLLSTLSFNDEYKMKRMYLRRPGKISTGKSMGILRAMLIWSIRTAIS